MLLGICNFDFSSFVSSFLRSTLKVYSEPATQGFFELTFNALQSFHTKGNVMYVKLKVWVEVRRSSQQLQKILTAVLFKGDSMVETVIFKIWSEIFRFSQLFVGLTKLYVFLQLLWWIFVLVSSLTLVTDFSSMFSGFWLGNRVASIVANHDELLTQWRYI